MKTQVESQNWFDRGDGAGKVFFGLFGVEDRRVGFEQVDRASVRKHRH
jgi:hypothetical protein